MRLRSAGIGLVLLTVAAVVGEVGIAAASGTQQSTLVSATPSTKTPNINDGTVYAIAQIGNRIIVGGSFTSVNPPGDTNSAHAVTRNHILAFDAATGAIDTSFVPNLDGTVEDFEAGPSPDTVYVGGEFSHVNGATGKGVTLLSTTTGQKVAGFTTPAMNGVVYSLARAGNHLVLGGTFTTLAGQSHGGIGSINATTGAVETYIGTPKLAPLEVPLHARRTAHIRPTPGRVVELVAEVLGLERGELFDKRRGGRGVSARAVAVQIGVRFGLPMAATGDALGIAPGSAARLGATSLGPASSRAVELIYERLLDELRR